MEDINKDKMANYTTTPNCNLACRVCLNVDNRKLFALYSNKLGDFYEELISTPVSPTDGLPQYICSYCKALLLKAVAFRRRCREAVSFLQNCMVKEPIKIDFLRNLRNPFHLPYTKSQLTRLEVPGNDSVNVHLEIKEELGADNYYNLNSEYKEDEAKELTTNDNIVHIKVINDINDINDGIDNDIGDDFIKSHVDDEQICEIKAESLFQNDGVFFKELNVDETDEEFVLNNDRKKKSKSRLCRTGEINTRSKKSVSKNSNSKSVEEKTRKTKLVSRKKMDKELKDSVVPELLKKSRTPTRQTFLDYVLKKYESESSEFSNKETTIVTDEDVNTDGTEFRIKEELDFNEKLVKDISVPIPRQIIYTYIRDIYLKKKEKFLFRTPKNYVNFDVMDQHRKEKLEEFAKDYDFSVKTFSDEEQKQFLQRLADKSKDCTFRCEHCLRGFSFETSFKNHYKLFHDPSLGPASCPVCSKRFRDARRMHLHALVHKYQLQCNQCGHICRDTSLAKTHYDTHKGQEFPCPYCGEIFKKYKSRTNHMSLRHATLTCDICYKKMAGEKALPLHRSLKHRETFPCDACETVFNTEEARTAHVRAIAAGVNCSQLSPCSACGENLRTESEKQEHIQKNHSRMERRTPCCPCRCKGKTKVPRQSTVTTGRKRTCGCYCSFRELNKEPSFTLGRKRQKYMCEICAQCKFQSLAHLRMHQLVHTGEKPFGCDHCHKTFRTKTGLQTHMTSHTGERNYQCSFCDKKFLTPSGLHRHQKSVHLKLRPHRCEMCNKMYTTSTDLKMHIRTAHLNMPWPKRSKPRRRAREQ